MSSFFLFRKRTRFIFNYIRDGGTSITPPNNFNKIAVHSIFHFFFFNFQNVCFRLFVFLQSQLIQIFIRNICTRQPSRMWQPPHKCKLTVHTLRYRIIIIADIWAMDHRRNENDVIAPFSPKNNWNDWRQHSIKPTIQMLCFARN